MAITIKQTGSFF